MTLQLQRFWQEEEGQDLVEYALLLTFISLATIAALSGVKNQVMSLWNSINKAISDAVVAAS